MVAAARANGRGPDAAQSGGGSHRQSYAAHHSTAQRHVQADITITTV